MWLAGTLGYLGATLAYVIFTLMLFAARNKAPVARWLLLCALVTLFANGVAAAQLKFGFNIQWAMAADAVKIAVWAVLILSFNSEYHSIKTLLKNSYIQKYLLTWLGLVSGCWLLCYLLDFAYEYLFLLFVLLNLWSLVLLEQLFRSANAQIRWAIWPLVIAIAGVSIFDFVLYAQAVMVQAIDFDFWYSRGLISIFVMPLLLVSTRRVKEGSVRIFVSRQVVFYSSMLMIAGIYLLVMALTGYLLNYLGGEWGDLLSIGFLLLSGIVLAVLLITESLRRRLKVFIAKNFFANKYEYRDEWLQLIGAIETTSAENYYQMATQIMMSKVDATSGAIVKRVAFEQFKVKYSQDMDIDESLSDDFLLLSQFCQKQGWIIDIDEYANDPHSYPSLFIQPSAWQKKGITYIVPIFIGKAFFGFFLLSENREERGLNWEDRDLIFAVSKQLGNFVSLHEANEKLAESKQFDAFNRMSAFLVHDLKNVQAQLSLITNNATKHRDNPEFIDDVFETVESATERLGKVLTQLRNKQAAQSSRKTIELTAVIEKVIEQRNISQPTVSFDANESCEIDLDDETFFSVMNHLIQNAQEATKDDGWVKVSLSATGKYVQIEIADNGTGMSSAFIKNRLFKPFDTTKGNAGMGIGVYEAKQFIESIAGEINVESAEGEGTTMKIRIPRVQ
ncbi:XrtA/PEP-CTERM system histidine kinase PrsK [Thalassotalea sp. PLHSN55]|uniref:XrtA/PEP-CTERM system histidine kinase PrsK n=1 Tax=Thalassotalea sp. PLHSN55 TaxID=3435888 RepID=UPI003F860946